MPALATIARELQVARVTPQTIDDVRNASPTAAADLDAYLDEYGQRIISTYDVTGKRLIEMPDVVLRSIAAASAEAAPSSSTPEDEHVQDELLNDARRAFASRDDHAGVSGSWPMGLVRRALLAAADRLVATGAMAEPEHVFDCTPDEVAAMLRGARAPQASVIAERAHARSRAANITPPSRLGVDVPPPDASVFPPSMRRMAEAMFAALRMLETSRAAGADGEGIGDRTHRGRAVVAQRAADAIERLEPGDVLVTSMTTPAFNCVLPVVGALVTMHGGQFSHAGIVARELGIPTVLGVPDALDRIPDGAIVDVDPVAGTVRVITV